MAVALDVSSQSSGSVISSPLNWSHTTSGSNRLLIVGFGVDLNDTSLAVTYNSVSMTKVIDALAAPNWGYIYVFGLIAPTTGANTISISWSSGNHSLRAAAVSYTGVAQSGFPDASVTKRDDNQVTSIMATITTVANNCWASMFTLDGQALSAGTNQTARQTVGSGGSNATLLLGDSNANITPAGNFSMTTNFSSSSNASAAIVSFAPFLSTTTSTSTSTSTSSSTTTSTSTSTSTTSTSSSTSTTSTSSSTTSTSTSTTSTSSSTTATTTSTSTTSTSTSTSSSTTTTTSTTTTLEYFFSVGEAN